MTEHSHEPNFKGSSNESKASAKEGKGAKTEGRSNNKDAKEANASEGAAAPSTTSEAATAAIEVSPPRWPAGSNEQPLIVTSAGFNQHAATAAAAVNRGCVDMDMEGVSTADH